MTEMAIVALVNEWFNEDDEFDFEFYNEGEHNLEEFTKENTKTKKNI